jgi:uroporphyrinogen-III synthase
MGPLQGIGVLVTRPEQQAAPLCRLLELEGAHTARLPAIEIEPSADAQRTPASIGALGAFDFVIFTSANAARFGSALLRQGGVRNLAAIGPATARALGERGYQVTLLPEQGFTSEALLADARLQHLGARRVLLVKGADGRPTLEQELIRRGAQVLAVDVYRRVPANPSAADLAAVQSQFAADRLHVVTATSLDIGKCLLGIAAAHLQAQFQKAHWLVPGERVAAGLREHGLQAPVLMAASAEDQDLVAALGRWRANSSEA